MPEFVVFIWAGASVPFGIPTMTQMTDKFEEKLNASSSPLLNLYQHIKRQLRDYQSFDIEALITVLQDIIDKEPSEVLNNPSFHYFSPWTLELRKMKVSSEDRANARLLLEEVKRFVADCCSIKSTPFEIYDGFFKKLYSKTAGNTFRPDVDHKEQGPRQFGPGGIIFTTNYDQVIEAYFNRVNYECECGQKEQGVLRIGRDNYHLYNSNEPVYQLFKLHGSINWYVDQHKKRRWQTQPAHSGGITSLGDKVDRELLIYPAGAKYTFREPFYDMFHHLKRMLIESERCYVVGYSFRDEDILGLFHDAIDLNPKFYLYLIDPDATKIAQHKFSNWSGRVYSVIRDFSLMRVPEASGL